jgi:hypothetical protein
MDTMLIKTEIRKYRNPSHKQFEPKKKTAETNDFE